MGRCQYETNFDDSASALRRAKQHATSTLTLPTCPSGLGVKSSPLNLKRHSQGGYDWVVSAPITAGCEVSPSSRFDAMALKASRGFVKATTKGAREEAFAERNGPSAEDVISGCCEHHTTFFYVLTLPLPLWRYSHRKCFPNC